MAVRLRRMVMITLEPEHHELGKRLARKAGTGLANYLEGLLLQDAKRQGVTLPRLSRDKAKGLAQGTLGNRRKSLGIGDRVREIALGRTRNSL